MEIKVEFKPVWCELAKELSRESAEVQADFFNDFHYFLKEGCAGLYEQSVQETEISYKLTHETKVMLNNLGHLE